MSNWIVNLASAGEIGFLIFCVWAITEIVRQALIGLNARDRNKRIFQLASMGLGLIATLVLASAIVLIVRGVDTQPAAGSHLEQA